MVVATKYRDNQAPLGAKCLFSLNISPLRGYVVSKRLGYKYFTPLGFSLTVGSDAERGNYKLFGNQSLLNTSSIVQGQDSGNLS